MNRNDGARGDARKRANERDDFDIPERFAYLIEQARADERDVIEKALQADMDEMEKHSTSIATGLYRAVRWIQIRRVEATR